MESLLLLQRGTFRRLLICPVARPSDVPSYALCFTSVGQTGRSGMSACKIDLIPVHDLDMSNYIVLLDRPIYGCLGLLKVANDEFLCMITAVSHIGTIYNRKLYRINRVAFFSLTSAIYDTMPTAGITAATTITPTPTTTSPCPSANPPPSSPMQEEQQAYKRTQRPPIDHPCAEVAVLLADGTFYFGYDWDATKSLQKILHVSEPFSWTLCERSFFWNRFLLKPLIKLSTLLPSTQALYLQTSGMLVAIFQGFASVAEFQFGTSRVAFALISRISCRRAGTRFKSRGIDDDGNVSNFVESETLFAHPEYTFSSIIVRGTVPVFWDQQGFQLGYPKIQLTRTPAATQPAFDRHIGNLEQSYGLIHVVDLLSQKDGQAEQLLSNAFEFHCRKYPKVAVLNHTCFDIYAICKSSNFERLESLFHLIGRDLQIFGYFVVDASGRVVKEQKGVFRVNCLDCLDRTNIVQSYILRRTLDLFMRNYLLRSGVTYDAPLFQGTLTELWTQNGDQLSRVYAGSNAIKSSYGRLGKFTFSSMFEDLKNSARRFYSNNFQEKSRQQAIDLFLGKTLASSPILLYSASPDLVEKELTKRRMEYCDKEKVHVQVLTWNTNGTIPVAGEDYYPLLSLPKDLSVPHIVAIGFQEIVQLNPTQIMSVDPERRLIWEGLLVKHLNERHSKHKFSLLVAHQLVGTTLSIFVRSDYLDAIRHVEIASKKTGMGGMAGNKGSVAIRMDIHSTSICLVSSHFAAGQTNAAERDRDWQGAITELQMSGGRDILAHDVILWFGDMNYRIDLEREMVKESIFNKNFDLLKEHDQLRVRMREKLVFSGFQEAPLNFAPTYKYDAGTNIYDSSEKMRVPSWTDRILYKGAQLVTHLYDRVEIDCSDHKPVKGFFEIPVLKVDKAREAALRQQIADALLEATPIDGIDASDPEPSACKYFDLIELADTLPVESATLPAPSSTPPPPLPPRPLQRQTQ